MLMESGDMEGALRAYAEAKQAAPKNALVLTKYGSALGEAGRSGEAIREYREALAVAPESAVVCNNLAWELASSGGDLQEARQLAAKALKQDGSNPYFQSTLAYIDLKAKRLPEAVQGFQALVRKDPGNPDHHFNLGMALAESGDKAKGKAEIEAALRLKPGAGERAKMERYLAGL
jgi:Flp pilus assembly protein TadD